MTTMWFDGEDVVSYTLGRANKCGSAPTCESVLFYKKVVMILSAFFLLSGYGADKDMKIIVTIQQNGDDVRTSTHPKTVSAENENRQCSMPVGAVTNQLAMKAIEMPPEPPASDSADPRRLVHYFCKMWKDEEYEKMYWAMTRKYRESVAFQKFKTVFEEDSERTGGLKDESLDSEEDDNGISCTLKVSLRFNYVKAKERRVEAILEKTKQGYRIRNCGMIPLDFNDL